MRIAYITANLPHGSDEAFLIPEIRELIRTGHDVLIVPRSPTGPILHGQELICQSRLLPIYSWCVLKSAAGAALGAPWKAARGVRLLAASRSAAVGIKNLAVMPKAVWLARVIREWKADHIHCHWAGTTATMAMLASKLTGIPWSLTLHRWDIVENNLLALKARSAAFARFISEDGLKMALALGVPARRARVLRMGVAMPSSGRRPRRTSKPIVLCPARLVEVKGHRYLFEAWKIVKDRGLSGELWLAGKGALRPELEELARARGISDSTHFLGALSHEELLRFYEEGAVSAVVLASVDLGQGHHEGTPVALIEAMSYGIPVVSTTTGGVPELIVPGSGLLVPPESPQAIAEAIERLLLDPNLSQTIGETGRQHVLGSYDIEQIVAKLTSAMNESRPKNPPAFLRLPILTGSR